MAGAPGSSLGYKVSRAHRKRSGRRTFDNASAAVTVKRPLRRGIRAGKNPAWLTDSGVAPKTRRRRFAPAEKHELPALQVV